MDVIDVMNLVLIQPVINPLSLDIIGYLRGLS